MSTITNIYNLGNVTVESYSSGGIAGGIYYSSTVKNVYNYGNVTSAKCVGGIIGNGNKSITIYNSFNRGNIIATLQSAGGIIRRRK